MRWRSFSPTCRARGTGWMICRSVIFPTLLTDGQNKDVPLMKRTRCPSLAAVVLITLSIGPCWADEWYALEISAGTTIGPPLLSTTLSVLATDALDRTFNNYAYAREDAAAFVASDGRIHGVQLERLAGLPRQPTCVRTRTACLCHRSTGVGLGGVIAGDHQTST